MQHRVEPDRDTDVAVDRIRSFNRFYTRRLELLDRGFLASPWTLGEVRILWELARRDGAAAAELVRDLGLDPGQLSRTLKRLTAAGLVESGADARDGRRRVVTLTERGRAELAPLEAEQRRRVGADVAGLGRDAIDRLVGAMADVERLLDPSDTTRPLLIRPHRAGDVSQTVARQAAYYAADHGFGRGFEGLIMEIGARFLADPHPGLEACFVAEVDGRMVGAVFVTHADEGVAKLRLLHVEAEMRGRGIGRRLVEAAIDFARATGHRRLTLWTNDILVDARRLYERAGFRCVAAEPHTMFGTPMVGETWDLDL